MGERQAGRRRLTLGILLVLSAELACAGAASRSGSDTPNPIALDGWRRAEYQGFTLFTNAPDATAQRTFRQLNRFTDFVSRFVFGHPFRASQRSEVFIFGTEEEYRRFAPKFVAGHARRDDDENQIALSVEQAFEGTRTLYHELVHTVLFSDPERRFPSWFHEGLAFFLHTSVLRGDVLTIGGLSRRAVLQISQSHPLPLRRLLVTPLSAQRDPSRFYADAWAFVHFGLLSASLNGPDRQKEFMGFVTRVSRGEAWEPAFRAAFAATPEEVEMEYERHRKKLAETKVQTLSNVVLELDEPALTFEPVGRLEIARELAHLGLDEYDLGIESAGLLFDLLLEADSSDPEAICGRIRVAAKRDEFALAKTLWERLSEDQRRSISGLQAEADLALALVRSLRRNERATVGAEDLARAIAGYRRILDTSPDRLSALVGLGEASILAEHEDPAAGISSLQRAVLMVPESPEVRLDLAELLIRANASNAAMPHLDYVIEAYPNSAFHDRAKRLRRRAR